jgi:hypothetical protein
LVISEQELKAEFSSTKNSFSNAFFNQAKKVIKIRFYLQKSLHSVASDFFLTTIFIIVNQQRNTKAEKLRPLNKLIN